MSAYNNWLHDYCAANPDRLVGVAVVPLQDPVLAIRELQRCVNELGCKGVMVRPAPYIGTHKLYHPVYDVFWKECTELTSQRACTRCRTPTCPTSRAGFASTKG